jgi:LPS-assembly lipoprotein
VVSKAYLERGRGFGFRVAPHASRPAWRALLALALGAALGACGFHLSTPATLPFKSLYILAPNYSSFAAELKRYIASASPGKLADRPDKAEVVLQILSENQEALILSLTTAGRVAEYQLRYRVSYRLHDNANKDWIPPTDILLRRDLTYTDQDVLGKENESNLLYQAMREDAVRQMVRRLSQARAPS